jgi:hypothetical protein
MILHCSQTLAARIAADTVGGDDDLDEDVEWA